VSDDTSLLIQMNSGGEGVVQAAGQVHMGDILVADSNGCVRAKRHDDMMDALGVALADLPKVPVGCMKGYSMQEDDLCL
jgi:hypothetical protein